jgi:hypothetical protein
MKADDDESGGSVLKCKKSRKDGYDTEEPFQVETALFLDFVLPQHSWWCHVPNGGHRHMLVGANLKRQGTRAGTPDNLVIWQGRAYWIELKARYGTLKASQKTTIPAIEAAGSPVAVARTLEDVGAALIAWGIPLRASLADFRARNRAKPATASTATISAAQTGKHAAQTGKHAAQTRMSVAEYRAHIGLTPAKPPAPDTAKSASWQALSAAIRQAKPRAKAQA